MGRKAIANRNFPKRSGRFAFISWWSCREIGVSCC
ncbi:hypothetical protein BVRB_2g047620 [Beta vulgaris subsp. vulgaris]|nr:hypothetical protein BVRB_2g047620 [Beta vulgaris subsp. vulgaris]